MQYYSHAFISDMLLRFYGSIILCFYRGCITQTEKNVQGVLGF